MSFSDLSEDMRKFGFYEMGFRKRYSDSVTGQTDRQTDSHFRGGPEVLRTCPEGVQRSKVVDYQTSLSDEISDELGPWKHDLPPCVFPF